MAHIFRIIIVIILLMAAAACQPTTTPPPDAGATTAPVAQGGAPVVDLTRPPSGESISAANISWDRAPNTVVFRAEVAGGDMDSAFHTRNDIPFCTVYGDNRVVWTISALRNDDTVVFDIVTDDTIRLFAERLVNQQKIYTYKTGADLIAPSEVEPIYERLTLFVNGTLHQTDSFGGWDYTYYQQSLTDCRSLSVTPVAYLPDAAWVSAQRVTYDPNRPSISWDGAAAALPLGELADAGQPRWLTGRNVAVLWDRLRSIGSDVQFEDSTGGTYQVAVEVPNVTRSAPPAP
ncbi:MAG: hypothetical protein H7Y11_11960 [Armatimonadetes bacterium]|nr:hypothetical protein [Anaerolineae bacterium]